MISSLFQCNIKDYDKLYRKARRCENNQHYETAIAAYSIIVDHFRSSPCAAEAKKRKMILEQKRRTQLQNPISKLTKIQKSKKEV